MMLDLLYHEYKNKPVGIAGVSCGSFAGSRMIGDLHKFCLCVGMLPIQPSLYFGGVRDLFEDSGKIKDEKYHARLERFLKELEWIAKKLR
jgi:NAD(P)H-dependent FMN reductase